MCKLLDMNYLYYEYAQSKICLIQEDQACYKTARSVQNYLNEKCLQNGSTLEGRKKAFAYQMNAKKFIPIVVNVEKEEVYFPTKSRKDANCIWINYANIKKVDYTKTTCTIHFKDFSILECENPQRIRHSIHLIFRYLQILKRN